MNKNVYEEPLPITREDAESEFLSGDPGRISNALVRISIHDSDWRWVQGKCLFFVNSEDPEVRGVAVTCIGHLARIHRDLELKAVVPLLKRLQNDPEIGGRIEDTLDDIESFVGQ